MVCDGVGGNNKGEVASKMVCEKFAQYLEKEKKCDESIIKEVQEKVIQDLNDYTSQHQESHGMATTLTLAKFQQDSIFLAWCGDSRIYHLRKGKVLYQTKDHSHVQMLYDEGLISKQEMASHPRKNIILGSIAANSAPSAISIHKINDFKQNDCLLLCSDGLLEHINETSLISIFQENSVSSNFAEIFNRYCKGKTKDNYSMILIIKK
jgi:PPM family protein phosphatase